MFQALPITLGKAEAVMELAGRAGIADCSGWGDGVPHTLARIAAALEPITNVDMRSYNSEDVGARWIPVHHPQPRLITPAVFTNGPPLCFDSYDLHNAFSPGFSVLSLQGGYFGHFFGGPLVVTGDQSTIITDVSSKYSGLHNYYDFDLRDKLTTSRFIDGTVIPITDDIRPLNFCHWLLDWLPRLSFLGSTAQRSSVYVVTTALQAAFQRESLRMCGFDDSRIIVLEDFEVLRARELLVPSDLRTIPHPASKAAPWAVSYLRSTIGVQSILNFPPQDTKRNRIYVSRSDAARRRVSNDQALFERLASLGYRCLTLSDLPLGQQASIFATASHVVSLHGAGLSNLVFSSPDTQVVEIFPARYGTPAFAALATGLGMPYATYVAEKFFPHQLSQFDDIEVNIDDFIAACGHIL